MSCIENTQEWRQLVSKLNPQIFHSVSSNRLALGDISFSIIEGVYRRHAPKSKKFIPSAANSKSTFVTSPMGGALEIIVELS